MSFASSGSRPLSPAFHSFLPPFSEIISGQISSLALSIILRREQEPPSLDLFSIAMCSLQSEPKSESVEKYVRSLITQKTFFMIPTKL